MAFPRWSEPLDKDEPVGKDYTFTKRFPEGDGFATVDIELVDSTSSEVLTETADVTIAISNTNDFGIIAGSQRDWGANFHAKGNGAPAGFHCVRLRYTTISGQGDDFTCRIEVKQN